MAKVLVVDDSVSVRTVVERALRSKRIEVLSAASGTEAMAQIRREEPDLVVCDVIMPDMEGYELCEFVRDHPRLGATPVLLMAGIVNSSVLARAAQARSNDVIRKPFAADELLSKIDGLLSVSTEPLTDAPTSFTDPTARVALAVTGEPIEDAKSVLSRLAAVPGVALAVLVDREGFLIESAGDTVLEAEAAGALAACLAEASEAIGSELRQGTLVGLTAEYEAGTILVNMAGAGAMLATVLCDPTLLGKVRYYVKKTLPDLLKVA
jgi:CheY-like chemotaxis protein/predicted regulator of Ras-like GTPase activity (Roadblock/LC7/MglB family)